MQRQPLRLGLALVGGFAALASASDARAQVAGSAGRPLPNVLLLVDNSGSMERTPQNTAGTGNVPPICNPGQKTSEVNRWGMLLQAMTGNFQPFFSCGSVARAGNTTFTNRYGINGIAPYDKDYFLPYHQPMTGSGLANACVIAPWKLPGVADGKGIGYHKLGSGGNATDYPDDALIAYKYDKLGDGIDSTAADTCTFDQMNDGQLDVSKAYARFALMTFDSLVERETGLTGTFPSEKINEVDPFKGQWSYLRHDGNPFFSTPSDTSSIGDGAQGAPGTSPACPPTFQEVGARNAGAPPWEGRLVKFPDPDATLYDLDAQNALIQQTLLATRPYGATPIDGLMDDARDYLFNDPQGPKDDPYKCRDKYIILLTDGAPNLNLRTACEATNGICPYPKAEDVADEMFKLPLQSKVTTYVIGFSVNGSAAAVNNDGFPATLVKKDCKSWFDVAAGGATDEKVQATNMQTACDARKPEPGTTGEACCVLNKIALKGSGQSAYFAESQADIVLSFGRIMANIIHSASTKTIPAFSPAASFSAASFAQNATAATKASSAQFIASYIPSAQTPWAGELDRTRFLCKSAVSTAEPLESGKGDFQSENVAVQSKQKERLFISVLADKPSTTIDSAATIRPFATNLDQIGNPASAGTTPYASTEVVMKNYNLGFETDWDLALNVTDTTCRAGRGVGKGGTVGTRGTVSIPEITDAKKCTEVIWGFSTAYPDPIKISSSTYDFNIRCNGATAASGTCSISGDTCQPSNPVCPKGETCVPLCAAMGAVYHSSPTVVGPPVALLREEGFRNFQAKYAKRRTVMYAATTDGLLHAFDAMLQEGPENHHELWSFAPPAVLPRMKSNYPAGNQILLDGAPVVRDVVWDRATSQLGEPKKWHTTLVAGLGTFGGYYAMNVTDADCSGGAGVDDCRSKYVAPGKGVPEDIGLPVDSSGDEGTPKAGPHFLWQLTDIPAESTETAKISRDSTIGSHKMAALFGKNTGTPAIGTVQIRATSTSPERQVGIAILPGGYDDPPIAGGECDRAAKPSDVMLPDVGAGAKVRTKVRQWAKGSCTTAPVPGRNVTIVRLDTGEVIRVFGRKQDTPSRLQDKLAGPSGVLETLFDSPMVGTPVVYPDQIGVPIQKIYIGDADGTLWRIDVSNTDPKEWKAYLFADLIAEATTANAANSQPIAVPPVLSTDESGRIIVHAATGDQESIVASNTLENFLYAMRDPGTATGKTQFLWRRTFKEAERITGPMVVFDKTVYFATYKPLRPAGSTSASCDSPGLSYLWGLGYLDGTSRWCPSGSIDTTVGGSGLCNAPALADNEAAGPDIIPGVALTATQSCVGADTTDQYNNAMFSSASQSTYSLSFGISRPNTGGGNAAQAARGSVMRPLPRMATQISSWSLVLE